MRPNIEEFMLELTLFEMPIMVEERRKHKRLRGKEGAFAVFLRGDELLALGKVVDISMGGLCARYLSSAELSADCCRIKLFGSNESFIHLDRMDCKIVHDREIPSSSLPRLNARHCGVRLYNLSFRQTAMLREFMRHFSFEETLE